MKDDSCGEIPVAFVVKSDGSKIIEDEIKQYVAKQVRLATDILKILSSRRTLNTSVNFKFF
jgi:hypothetical protein